MNILLYLDNFIQKSETFIINHIKWLVEEHNVFVLCEQKIREPLEDITIIELGKNREKSHSKIISIYRSKIKLGFHNKEWKKRISKIIEENCIDVIHCHFGIQGLKLLDNYSGNIPVIFTFHGYDITKWVYQSRAYKNRLKNLFTVKNFHAILVCNFHLQILIKNGIHLNGKYSIIYNGVDLSFFYPQEKIIPYKTKDIVRFLQVSRFVDKKGHAITLKAFAKFKQSHPTIKFKLFFVGDGPLHEEIYLLSKSLDLQDEVIFSGWKTQSELVNLYDQSDIYVQHSVTSHHFDMEATTVSILEAMAMHLPILSSIHAGIPEIVENGVNGILVEERNIEEYVRAIYNIHSWTKLKGNRKKVLEKFSIEKNKFLLSKVYKKLKQESC